MELATVSQGIALFGAGLASASLAMAAITGRRHTRPDLSEGRAQNDGTVFLFRGTDLIDATAAGRLALAPMRPAATDLARVLALLHARFPALGDALTDLPDRTRLCLMAEDGTARIDADWCAGHMRIRLTELDHAEAPSGVDGLALAAMNREIGDLRVMADKAAVPVWRTTRDGRVIWANAAYLELADAATGPDKAGHWPPAHLFQPVTESQTPGGPGRRLSVALPGEEDPRWFRCLTTEHENSFVFTAIPEDSAVRAEQSLSSFIQTLSNTFAHLTAGLAIFDRNRHLTMFNPALTDLTGLPGEFMIARPSLFAFLDRLRDQRITPEPKDYKSWRTKLTEVETAAREGTYSELWPLSDGRTFRVTGRPHHDGAIAFVFEDISAEISLTRRFRAELETSQAVLDSLDEALAVFSAAGILTMSNQAYATLWQSDPMTSLSDSVTFLDATRRWQKGCVPTPIWGDARDFAATIGERAAWSADIRTRDGTSLTCRFEPLTGGATLVGFRTESAAAVSSPADETRALTG